MLTVKDALFLLILIFDSLLAILTAVALCDHYWLGSRKARQKEKGEKKVELSQEPTVEECTILTTCLRMAHATTTRDIYVLYTKAINNRMLWVFINNGYNLRHHNVGENYYIDLRDAVHIEYGSKTINLSEALKLVDSQRQLDKLEQAKELIRQYDKDNNYKFINEI